MKNNIIAVANWKGGCGKTLVSALLCHYLRLKEIPVMAIDADVQQSLFRQRMFELQGSPDAVVPWELQYLDTSNVDGVREQMKALKVLPSCVVVDCPGNITDSGMVPVYEAADIIVVPSSAKSKVNLDNLFLQGTTGYYYMDRSVLERVAARDDVERVSAQVFMASLRADCCSILPCLR